MKRYIHYIQSSTTVDVDTSMFSGTPFVPDTDMPYYNQFLSKKNLAYMQSVKNLTGDIVLMSPNEYYAECVANIFHGRSSLEDVKLSRKSSSGPYAEYLDAMRRGDKFPVPVLNYADDGQEGLHRMMVAGDLYGWDTKFPVLVVSVYDEDIERENQLFRDYLDFRDHEFKEICQEAEDELSDWYGPVPDNFETLLHNKVIEIAKAHDADIDVTVKMSEVDNYHRVDVFIDRYFDYDASDRYEGETLWLENMYDVKGDRSSRTYSQADLSDDDYEAAAAAGVDFSDYDSIVNYLMSN